MAIQVVQLNAAEQARTGGFTHKAIITYAEVAAIAGVTTAGAIALMPYTAGTAFQAAAYKLVTGFAGTSITNLTIEVGWNGASTDDPNGLIEASEIATAGTEINYLLANGAAFATKLSGYVALDAGNIEATFTSTGANLSVLTSGEIHVYLAATDLTKI